METYRRKAARRWALTLQRLKKLAASLGIRIDPLIVGDEDAYGVRLDKDGYAILEQFKDVPMPTEVVPWMPNFTFNRGGDTDEPRKDIQRYTRHKQNP